MKHLSRAIDDFVHAQLVKQIAVRVGMGNDVLYDTFRGNVDTHTLFDMASVTKIMATTSLALIALDRGMLNLHDPVDRFYPTDTGLTIWNLLTHTVGIGHKALNRDGYTYDNIAEKILEIPPDIPVGSDVQYSCPGFILLGKILEKIFGKRLDACFAEWVAKPMDMRETGFLPGNRKLVVNSNQEEEKRGIVNDYNCQFLGGIAGNAGLFSNISDITKYVGVLRNGGEPLVRRETFSEAIRNHTKSMSESRGLGFLYVDERYPQTGDLFAEGAIGHCGHTGQSIFVDHRSGLYVIILSDATISTVRKYGTEYYNEVMDMRARLHAAIGRDLQEA